jgi:hypothetical protein
MVRGLDLFRNRLGSFEGSFVLIGGAACDEWFTIQGLPFRTTKDLDIVLLIEVIDQNFVTAMHEFVDAGGYQIRHRTDGVPILYRFANPADDMFPFMLELFSRNPDKLILAEGQTILPVNVEPDHHSLSAILLDVAYYRLIQTEYELRDGIRFATVTSLIPLKARAWLDLTTRRDRGEKIDSKDIDKHRSDVFRLAGTLPGEPGPQLADAITADIAQFLGAFPDESGEWPRILDALKATLGTGLNPASLREAIQTYFRLPGA